MTASQNRTTALAALVTQMTALVDDAAIRGQLSILVLTSSILPNQQTYLTNNGYTTTVQGNGFTLINWDVAE